MKAKLTERIIKDIIPKQAPYEIVDSEINGFILRIQPSGILTYYLVYRTTDRIKKRYRLGRHGSITLSQARDLAKQFSAKTLLGQDIQEEKKTAILEKEKAKARTLEGFIESHYAPWVTAERRTGLATIKMLKFNFSNLMQLPLEDISPLLIEKWRAEQLKNGKAAASINRNITAIKAVLSKAVAWSWLEISPLIKLKQLKTDNLANIRYLEQNEENKLLTALKERDQHYIAKRISGNAWRADRGYDLLPELDKNSFSDHLTPMVLLAINTGMRRGELFSLRWSNVDLNKATITVTGDNAKSGKTRHIPLNNNALLALKIWYQQNQNSDLVFPNHKGQQMDNVRKSWDNILKNSNITNFRWHDLRHHFASKLVMAGVDLNTVRELLGHSDLEVTLRYAHLAPEHKAEAVARLE